MKTSNQVEFQFSDFHPQPADFFQEVISGLQAQPRFIPPKFFYDQNGSRLFDEICRLPEYYPTRVESQILCENAATIASSIGHDCLLIEPGSGSSEKIRILLSDLRPKAYMPMDISKEHLIAAANRLVMEYPWLNVHAACIDFTGNLTLPECPQSQRKVVFFPGSSIGNFEPRDAVKFMTRLANLVGVGGGLLIGVDLKKRESILNAAYNDQKGVTADFNLNLLTRINRELNADCCLENFEHYAVFNRQQGRVEMHLISKVEQVITVDDHEFSFSPGQSVHTENSYKYHIQEFQALAYQAGFEPVDVWIDRDELFSVQYFSCFETSQSY